MRRTKRTINNGNGNGNATNRTNSVNITRNSRGNNRDQLNASSTHSTHSAPPLLERQTSLSAMRYHQRNTPSYLNNPRYKRANPHRVERKSDVWESMVKNLESDGQTSGSAASTRRRTARDALSQSEHTYKAAPAPASGMKSPPLSSNSRKKDGLKRQFSHNLRLFLKPFGGSSVRKQRGSLLSPSSPLPPEEIPVPKDPLDLLLDDVLQAYPEQKCKTFADHVQFATAELTTNHMTNPLLYEYLQPQKFNLLKAKLEARLMSNLSIDDEDGGNQHIQENLGQQQPMPLSPPLDDMKTPTPQETLTSTQNGEKKMKVQATLMEQKATTSTASVPNLLPQDSGDLKIHQNSDHNRQSPKYDEKQDQGLTSEGNWKEATDQDEPLDSTSSTAPCEDEEADEDDEDNSDSGSTDGMQLDKKTQKQIKRMPFTLLQKRKKGGSDNKAGFTRRKGYYTGSICIETQKPHGVGTFEFKGKSGSYNGQWNQGSFHGTGCLLKSNGDVYEGQFIDGFKHGTGKYTYNGGSRIFKGRYVQNERVEGRMAYGDGSVYNGQWQDGKRHGKGAYIFPDGSKYKGQFVNDSIHGTGRMIWPDGSKYVGEWAFGMKQGSGKEFHANGELSFDTFWKEGEPVYTNHKI